MSYSNILQVQQISVCRYYKNVDIYAVHCTCSQQNNAGSYSVSIDITDMHYMTSVYQIYQCSSDGVCINDTGLDLLARLLATSNCGISTQ